MAGKTAGTRQSVNSSCRASRSHSCRKFLRRPGYTDGERRRAAHWVGIERAALVSMRDLEVSPQEFGEFLLKSKLVREKSAPFIVRWVRRFLSAPASEGPLADQTRRFCEELERSGRCEDWQVRQAEHAIRIYFVNFLGRADWHRQPSRSIVDEGGGIDQDGMHVHRLGRTLLPLRRRTAAIGLPAHRRRYCSRLPDSPGGSATRVGQRRICCSTASTSGRFRSTSATRTSRRR